MKTFTNQHTFNSTWSKVTLAYFNKYPNNYNKNVKEIDYYYRDFNEDIITLKRLVTFNIELPFYINKLKSYFLPDFDKGIIQETILIDRNTNKMSIVAKNLINNKYLNVTENSLYYSKDNTTHYEQTFYIDTPYKIIEEFVYKTLKSKSKTGIQVIQEQLNI